MLPSELKAEQFSSYPPQARKLAVDHLGAIQQLPLSFVPSLLKEVIDYDFKFPAERTAIDRELAVLSALSAAQVKEWFQAFFQLTLSPKLEHLNWINLPAQFVEQLSEYLWDTHQLDSFRNAAMVYGDRLRVAMPPEAPVERRLGIAVIGEGVATYDAPLFRNLRQHGTYFAKVKPENGFATLLNSAAARAQAHPVPYGHWYVDGGPEAEHSPLLTCVSYQSLAPVRDALLRKIQTESEKPGMGPEQLRSNMARLSPEDLGMGKSGDQVLDRFQIKLLTEGSGTQIFSTTFAQWTAREVLRRAQALTLVVRFGPRQRQRPMNELLSSGASGSDLDYVGSLVDGDMGAYYNWLNQQRLPGSENSTFLVWFEGHSQALAIGPGVSRGKASNAVASLSDVLGWAAG